MLTRRGSPHQAPSNRVPVGLHFSPLMSGFIGGSAYTMVRDIAEGYIIASELTFKKFNAGEFQQFGFEADKLLREVRATVVPTGDTEATQKRHRKMQRLQQAMTIAGNVRSRVR
jgi:hypothetical protein